MMYKHRETGRVYKKISFSNFNGKQEQSFRTACKPFEEIKIVTPWVANPDSVSFKDNMEEYRRLQKMNDDALKNDILKVFEEVDTKPEISFCEKLEYIEVVGQMKCPFCGSRMKFTGEVLLSYPAQYPHKCTNDDCGYSTTVSRWHEGEIYYGESVEEVEKLLNGSLDDYEILMERTRQMRVKKNTI